MKPIRYVAVPAVLMTVTACAHGGTHEPRQPDRERGPEVTADDIDRTPMARVEDHMVGRFPGVRIIPLPNGGFSVRLWGPTSLVLSQEPLYVVDGMPVRVDPGQGLFWLNPSDIASIRVLKNPADTAIWGVRGGNGVIVITTRGADGGG